MTAKQHAHFSQQNVHKYFGYFIPASRHKELVEDNRDNLMSVKRQTDPSTDGARSNYLYMK